MVLPVGEAASIAGFQISNVQGNKTGVTSLCRPSLLSRPLASLSPLPTTMDVDIKIKDEIDDKRTDRDSDRGGRDYDRDRDRDGERSSRRERSRDRRDSGERVPVGVAEDPSAPTSKLPGRRRNDHYEPDDRRAGGDVRLPSPLRVLHSLTPTSASPPVAEPVAFAFALSQAVALPTPAPSLPHALAQSEPEPVTQPGA